MRFNHVLCILLTLLIYNQHLVAEEQRTEIKIDFRVNTAHIDPGFANNATRLDEIVEYLNLLDSDSTRTVTSVSFCGTASPEGSYELNRSLAGARLAELERLIRGRVQIPDSIVSRDDSYIPWNFLREQIAQSDLARKDTILKILAEDAVLAEDPDNGKLADRRIIQLKRLDNRRTWDTLCDRYFSRMRSAVAVIITTADRRTLTIEAADFTPSWPEPTVCSVSLPDGIYKVPATRRSHRQFRMALHTNMLYDALLLPNIGAEFHLGGNWSVGGNWMYAWWSRDSRHRYWRAYGGDLHARYWFGKEARRRPLTGHHAGIYGQILTYDFEFGGKGYQGGRWTKGFGIDYGYSLPVARHLNIDFSVGIGYATGEYKKYHPEDNCYVWESTHILKWFGPTKAEVSLVWLIGGESSWKGGRR